jgi:hypothetical protein
MSMTKMDEGANPITTQAALDQWRDAERAASMARRGRVTAQTAADAAASAAQSAQATAEAAQAALASMELAEAAATETAQAARLFVTQAGVNLADAEAELAATNIAESDAHDVYRAAVKRAGSDRA